MKLHGIRVTNLNSLYGEHFVDLDGDLQGASLFLIQGPTGSGKSTLMDAVSLSLFGTTPRLDKLGSEQAVAEQVMSRGTGEAQAVVEFSKWEQAASRRVRYRATWTARRAHKRPQGKMQATVRGIERLEEDGSLTQLVSDKRAKVFQPVFETVLERFTVQDFQRSMLLAQGRFDAMLHALPEERAAILERLTDTADYLRLGARAARMRGAWQGRLATLEARVEAITAVTPEDLEAAQNLVHTGAQALELLDARWVCLGGWRDWLVLDSKLLVERNLAQGKRAVVAEHERAAAADLASLSEHERCAAALTLLDQRSERSARMARVDELQRAVADDVPRLAEAHELSNTRAQSAIQAVLHASTALEGLRQPVQLAQDSARAVKQARAEASAASKKLTKIEAALGQEERAQAGRVAAERAAEQVLSSASSALAGIQGDAALAKAYPRLSQDAAAVAEAWSGMEREREALETFDADLTERAAGLARDRDAHDAGRALRLEPLQSVLKNQERALRALVGDADPDTALRSLRLQREAHLQRAQRLEAALLQVVARAEAEARAAERSTRAGLEAGEVQLARAVVQERDQKLSRLAHEREQAREVTAPLERIAELCNQREALADAEPCPLCGSLEHPFVDDPVHSKQTRAVQAELRTSRATLQETTDALEAGAQQVGQAREALAAAKARAATALSERDLSTKQARHLELLVAQALREAGLDPGSDEKAVRTSAQAVDAEARSLLARVDVVEKSRAAELQARASLEDALSALAREAAALDLRSSALQERRIGRQDKQRALAVLQSALDKRRDALARAFAVFDIHEVPAEAGLAEAQRREREWTAADQTARDSLAARDTAHKQVELGHQAVEKARAGLLEADTERQMRRGILTDVQAEAERARTALQRSWQLAVALDPPATPVRPLPSDDPISLLQSQERRVADLGKTSDTERQAFDQAASKHAEAVVRLEELGKQLMACGDELRTAQASLDEAMALLAIPDVESLAGRRLSTDRLAVLRAARDKLHQARVQADAAADATLRQHARHLEQRPEDIPDDATPDSLAPDIEQARAGRQRCSESLDDARAKLRQAQLNIQAAETARAALDQARANAAVWLDLHKLIGVNDGKRFQLFAQALNLDQLLVSANRHLERLNGRYRLQTEKVQETGLPTLEFEVEDRFELGSTRSLKTLSGGESFLVSLALALGLSDLRTSSMPVETLMLDEGFGTLDPRTLETALRALEQLRASGRQVGIISHVAGLQERIEARVLVEPLGEGRSRVRAMVEPTGSSG